MDGVDSEPPCDTRNERTATDPNEMRAFLELGEAEPDDERRNAELAAGDGAGDWGAAHGSLPLRLAHSGGASSSCSLVYRYDRSDRLADSGAAAVAVLP